MQAPGGISKETPSLNKIFDKKTAPVEDTKKEVEQNEVITATTAQSEVSEENVQTKINEYVAQHSLSGAIKVILTKPIKLIGTEIELSMTNSVEISMVQKIEVELLGFLRHSLNNSSIKFKFNVAKDDSERRPYTSIEVFAAMAKKNPTLLKLRDEFGLDTE